MMKLRNNVLYAVIAALYTVLSLVLGNFSFGIIQFRYAEVLNVFCLKDKKYIYALGLGCFITNLVGVMLGFNELGYIDAILGTLATVVAGYLMYELRNVLWFKKPILSLLMPAIINGVIIGLELAYVFPMTTFLYSFAFYFFAVFVSEFIIVTIFGLIFLESGFKLLEKQL